MNPLAPPSPGVIHGRSPATVEWSPWGAQTMARAQREDKPILLSIGYASCHWCHVMARESFDDPSTAALLNDGFICVRVDREERPDIDQVYQLAHQLLRRTGGGWPLTIFLSPQGVPFYSGTYFPRHAQADQPAFGAVLGSVSTVWSERRDALAQQDRALLARMAAALPRLEPRVLDATALSLRAREQLDSAFDVQHGGFGGAPKFAHPSDLTFLLRRARATGDARALEMALTTLRKMAEGGLHDQIGGGFFRYSVDAKWALPHFEKMLCDNAVLLALYADALEATGEPLFRRVVEATAQWAVRELRADAGGFHASLAADDARGREGGCYVWEPEPMRLALSPNEWDVCAAHWGLVDAPTVDGRCWHLRVARPLATLATTLGRPEATLSELVESARAKLLAVREQRDAPARDPLILTGWNALMVTGLTRAAVACQRPDWLLVARQTLSHLKTERWVDGRLLALPAQAGFLDDHAFVLEAVLALHDAAPQEGDLGFATAVAQALLGQFEDPEAGGFFFTRNDAPALIHRPKTAVDTATPSGNGSAAVALQALAQRLGEPRYALAAQRCVQAFGMPMRQDPASHTRLLQAAEAA